MTQPPDDDPMASMRPYLQMASGLLGMSAAKAAELAQGLWTQGGEVVGGVVGDAVDQGAQAASAASEQVAALMSPDQIRSLVREEVDRVVRRLGFAREDELASLRREVGRLEQQVASLQARLDADAASTGEAAPKAAKKAKQGKAKKHKDHEGAST